MRITASAGLALSTSGRTPGVWSSTCSRVIGVLPTLKRPTGRLRRTKGARAISGGSSPTSLTRRSGSAPVSAATGRLSQEAIERGLETLAVFERFCAAHGLGPDDVHAVATSAIRDASNGEYFLDRRARGQRAADRDPLRRGRGPLRLRGRRQHDDPDRRRRARDRRRLDAADRGRRTARAKTLRSFPLGAVRLTEQFLPGSGPAKKKDLQRLRAHVRDALSDLTGARRRRAIAWSASAAPCATWPPPPSACSTSRTSASRAS